MTKILLNTEEGHCIFYPRVKHLFMHNVEKKLGEYHFVHSAFIICIFFDTKDHVLGISLNYSHMCQKSTLSWLIAAIVLWILYQDWINFCVVCSFYMKTVPWTQFLHRIHVISKSLEQVFDVKFTCFSQKRLIYLFACVQLWSNIFRWNM